MSELSDQLIAAMQEHGVELNFDGRTGLFRPNDYKRMILPREPENLSVSLSMCGMHERDYFLKTDEDNPYWVRISKVFLPASYQPELIAAAIIHLQGFKSIVQANLPRSLEPHVDTNHLHLLNFEGAYAHVRDHGIGMVPIYDMANSGEILASRQLSLG